MACTMIPGMAPTGKAHNTTTDKAGTGEATFARDLGLFDATMIGVGAMGFISGWMLWFAYTVACARYALGLAGYFWDAFHKYMPVLSKHVFGAAGSYLPVAAVTVLIAYGLKKILG